MTHSWPDSSLSSCVQGAKVLELKYGVPEGIDPETLARFSSDLASFEIDFALEKAVKGVPSYVPVSFTL